MAIGDIAGTQTIDLEVDNDRLFGFGTEGADDRLQRTHQRRLPGFDDALPQRMDFGQGNAVTIFGMISAMISSAARPGLVR